MTGEGEENTIYKIVVEPVFSDRFLPDNSAKFLVTSESNMEVTRKLKLK